MESTAEVVAAVNGKRGVMELEDGNVVEGSPPKRIKGSDREIEEDVKEVAEIVLVLAAMGKMRGGKGPSDVEKQLMGAARRRLAKLCEGFAPKDVFPREAFGGVIEDLGLSKLKEQKLGFHPPTMSIADKLLVSMKKMERAEQFAASSQPSRLPGNTAHGADSRSVPHSVRSSSSYQLPTSEIRPGASSGSPVPRVDRHHLRSDGRPNSSCTSQPPDAISFKPGAVTQTASRIGGLQPHGATSVQSFALRNDHAEIAKIVQKFLRPRETERPAWDPPSRDYMNKSLTCQVCRVMTADIDSILICDACEKGYHYAKCLGMKEVARVEWHCAKCLSLSNGNPLPPKYGRVMRNASTGRVSSSDTVPAISVGASVEKPSSPATASPANTSVSMFRDSSASSYDHSRMVIGSKESHFDESLNGEDHLKDNLNQEEYPVKWFGDPIQVFEEKYFYASCVINGHPLKTFDHALVHFDSGKVRPAKIQALWEDKNTAMKWITANQCYFPDDFPDSIGRPCGLENDEVCESTHGHVCSAGSIEGPCLVLPPREFSEESERRAHSVEQQLDDHLPPLYLCKWIYDEAKGVFTDASFR